METVLPLPAGVGCTSVPEVGGRMCVEGAFEAGVTIALYPDVPAAKNDIAPIPSANPNLAQKRLRSMVNQHPTLVDTIGRP